MSLSPLVEQHLEDLARHPHIQNITEIKPLVYKLTYWPRDLESLYAEIPYTLKLTIPQTYPEKPPFVTFLQKIHHLNIHPSTGQLSMSILSQDWSPFLNLKAVINSLDQVLQQPDQTHASTPILLEQYQTDITTYVQSVKESLQKNNPKDHFQKNEHIYTEQQVEEVIEVDDFNEYQIKRAENNFVSHQHQEEIQNIQFGEKTDFIRLQEGQKHDYSFNHDSSIKDNQSVNEKKSKKEQKSDGQLSVKVQKPSFKPSQLKPPALNIDSQNTSPKSSQNNNLNSTNLNTDPKTNLTKFQKVVNQSNNLLTGKIQKKRHHPDQYPQKPSGNQQNHSFKFELVSKKSKDLFIGIKFQNFQGFKEQKIFIKFQFRVPVQHQRSYQGLKQNMTRCKQLIAIFSEELDEMESSMEKNKSKRIKTLLQDKCNKLEQMILELFEINQKTQFKLMDMVRKGANQYL